MSRSGHDPDAIVDLIGFAVGITSMVHKSGDAEAVNDRVTVVHGKEVRYLVSAYMPSHAFEVSRGPVYSRTWAPFLTGAVV